MERLLSSSSMLLCIIFILLPSHFGVERKKFRSCADSSFCTRQRNYSSNRRNYKLDPDSISLEGYEAQIVLFSDNSEKRLKMSITFHKESIVRVLIDELAPLRRRYRTAGGEALKAEPENLPIFIKWVDTKLILFASANHHVEISCDPLNLVFFAQNDPLVSVNEMGLLYFEHQLPNSGLDHPEWVESFDGHNDSRPRGPESVGTDVNFLGFDHVYGIPEHADSFSLSETKSSDPYRLYNLDVFEYELHNHMALYGSVPLMWAHRGDATVGVFWNNPSETWVDVNFGKSDRKSKLSSQSDSIAKTHWMSESGVIDLFIMLNDNPVSALKSYASLTGTTPLPPLFSLAHHQSRWNYKNETDVASISHNYSHFNIPLDVIWLDIEYANEKRYLTWNADNFENPNDMVHNLTMEGRKLVVVVDPHIKRDNNWDTFRDFESRNMFVKQANGKDFDGWCWPGSSSWPDFLQLDVREAWSNLFTSTQFLRSDLMFYAWNDMNEPSVFSGSEVTIGKDTVHDGKWENRDIHNLYGLFVHQATWDGLIKRSRGVERPFVLTRAFFAGSQRTAAVWTGDNRASWEHLQITIPMLLTLSITGMTFCGADVGGFFGNPPGELLVRWYQAAVFQPFLRSHAHLDSPRREPWTQSLSNMNHIRNALAIRYSLLPYWYTLFARGEFDGQPPFAPLFLHFPTDKTTFAIDNEHMVGEALLVHPVVHEDARLIKVYLPDGIWYLFSTWKMYRGGQSISIPVTLSSVPFFYRGGYVVPKKEIIRASSSMMSRDPYTIVISLDLSRINSEGYLYLDDFHSNNKSNAQFFRMEYQLSRSGLADGNPSGFFKFTRLPCPGSSSLSPVELGESVSLLERLVVVGFDVQPLRATHIDLLSGRRENLHFSYVPPLPPKHPSEPPRAGLVVISPENLSIVDSWKIHLATDLDTEDEL